MARPKNSLPKPTLVQDQKTKIWHVSFTHPEKGYTVKRSTGTRDRAEAGTMLHAIGGDVVGEHVGLKPASADYKVGELLNAYKLSKERLADSDRHALDRLLECFGGYKPDQLGPATWKKYRAWRTSHQHVNASAKYQKVKRTVSDSTAVRELRVFRAAIRWAQASSHWKGLQHVRVMLPNSEHGARHEYLTRDEVLRLVDACEAPHLKLFVMLAIATAGRHSAILNLKWEQVTWPSGSRRPGDVDFIAVGGTVEPERRGVDEATGEVVFDDGVDYADLLLKGPIRIDLGKDVGNKLKPVAVVSPTNTRLYEALIKAYAERSTDYVIEWKQGGIGRKIERVDLTDAYARAGLKKPSAPQHVLKHTAISWMIQDGQQIEKVAKLTRTSIATIEKFYGHLAPKHLEVVGEVLSL